jgi:hypothetical protein
MARAGFRWGARFFWSEGALDRTSCTGRLHEGREPSLMVRKASRAALIVRKGLYTLQPSLYSAYSSSDAMQGCSQFLLTNGCGARLKCRPGVATIRGPVSEKFTMDAP